MEMETQHTPLDGRPKKRARMASTAEERTATNTAEPVINLLPVEMLAEIVQNLSPADLVATTASGAPLASAAQAVLSRRLEGALKIAGVSEVDSDPVGAATVLHNAISHDDVVALKAILGAGFQRTINEPLPPIKSMVEWETPIAAVFYLHGCDTIEGAYRFWDRRSDGAHLEICDVADDVGMLARRDETCRVLPPTPLVRAILCGARRCVRALLAAGAHPHPSPEALLGAAVERVVLTHVAIAERCPSGTWYHCPDRATDRAGIVEDLTAAFVRTPPPLPLMDANPLSMLRYGASVCDPYGDGPTKSGTLFRAAKAVYDAGYSPDEPVSRLPTPYNVARCLLLRTVTAPASPSATYGSHYLRDMRCGTSQHLRFPTLTERQAAVIIASDYEDIGISLGETRTAEMVFVIYEHLAPLASIVAKEKFASWVRERR
ncbi:hypothetical protein pkur_cds_671 [Pandoravirus kuranda]|uniref:Uncharacterized protein n=1 Tax=Pandoravirus kuranda TaxID=3019033 RepID=A0AA95EF54_9VIRU|nr:hypothetical protein pkur_cds_671 [Pandoravirus kuranda]